MENNKPQGTAVAPQGTAVAPQGTAVAPQGTAVAPQNVATDSNKQSAPSYFNLSVGENLMINGTQYTIAELISSGTEAEIYRIAADGKDYAVKLYKKGYLPNTKIFRQLQEMQGKNVVVDIYDSGSLIINNVGAKYELMQYIACGAVSKEDLRGKANDIADIVISAAVALDEFHKHGLIHKDIKPANLLRRKDGSNDVVLCDFGISDIIGPNGICATIQSRTPIYAAPEVYTDTYMIGSDTYCEITEKADYYSLGMTILSLWYGEAMFRSKEAELASQKRHGHLQIPHDMPEKLAKIVRGLTVINPKTRWDLQSIKDYLSGKDVAVDEGNDKTRQLPQQSFNFVFNSQEGKIATNLDELVQFMQEDNDLAVKYLYKGVVSRNLQIAFPDLSLQIDDIVEKKYPRDEYSGLYSVLFLLKPDLPIGLTGYRRDNGMEESVPCLEIKDIVDFCCTHYSLLDGDIEFLLSRAFIDWVERKDPSASLKLRELKNSVSDSDLQKDQEDVVYYYLMLQELDSSVDVALNKITGKRLKPEAEMAHYLSLAVCAFEQIFDEDSDKLEKEWGKANFEHKTELSPDFIASILGSAVSYEGSWLQFYMNYKGIRQQWDMVFAKDEDNLRLRKLPYSHMDIVMEAAKNVIGSEMPPYYILSQDLVLNSLDDLTKLKKPVLHEELEKGLYSWILLAFPDTLLSDKEMLHKAEEDFISFLKSVDPNNDLIRNYHKAMREEADERRKAMENCLFWNNPTKCVAVNAMIGYRITLTEEGLSLKGLGNYYDSTGLGKGQVFFPMKDFNYESGVLTLVHSVDKMEIYLNENKFKIEDFQFEPSNKRMIHPNLGCIIPLLLLSVFLVVAGIWGTWFDSDTSSNRDNMPLILLVGIIGSAIGIIWIYHPKKV